MTDTPKLLLAHHLKTLKLPTVLREFDKVAQQCAAEGLDHVQFLARLVELELIDRERRIIERRIKAAKFPAVKSLDSFDFKVIPSLNKMQVLELARCEKFQRECRLAFKEPWRALSLALKRCPPERVRGVVSSMGFGSENQVRTRLPAGGNRIRT